MSRPRKYNTEEELKKAMRIARKKYRNNNLDKVHKQVKKWQKNNPDKTKRAYKKWRKNNLNKAIELTKMWRKNNPEKVKGGLFNYRKNNPEKVKAAKRESYKKRILIDCLYKIKENTRKSISKIIKRNGYSKKSRSHEILGCSFEFFKTHLESKFEPWMNWSNYGKYKKDIK
jgi:hypothetical protein